MYLNGVVTIMVVIPQKNNSTQLEPYLESKWFEEALGMEKLHLVVSLIVLLLIDMENVLSALG